jgi:chromosome segregation protein
MLKALELAGFKSFADKTRFEFPRGITVVVGPNGSGKSNIVDAIKWVLGEQSIKSLRGKEMADVIFNGSPTRRGMNAAEVTLTFDNKEHRLAIDAPEVHVTRRVYRSGEGEYLINRNPCRLRDIRDLLAGTGLGSQAYSVIEQGKVDGMLQASPRDRRVIFEEAAGISRFKLKKVEALRRLERVQQNLLRLSDIVEEVDNRLRSVRAQAGKARRYKEYSDRLQELRTQVGMVDWRRLTARIDEHEGELKSLTQQRDAAAAEAESLEAQVLANETEAAGINEGIRAAESRLAENRERIAAQEATIAHQRTSGRQLDEELSRLRQQLVALSARAEDWQQQWQETAAAVSAAEEQHRNAEQQASQREKTLAAAGERLEQLRSQSQERRSAYLAQMRAAAALGTEMAALKSQAEAAAAATERSAARLAELEAQLRPLAEQLQKLRAQRDAMTQAIDQQNEQLSAERDRSAAAQRRLADAQEELAGLRQRQSAAAERASVLEELQRRQEGVSAGVREVLAKAASAAQAGDGPLRGVRGLVADLLNVSVEMAPLVEAALGPAAQYVVAEPSRELLEHLRDSSPQLAGRVGVVWLDGDADADSQGEATAVDGTARSPFPTGDEGVVGRADRFVETQAALAPLATRLLGRTWIVKTLADALRLAATAGGVDLVTMAGEVLQGDGTLIVGPRDGTSGLISRRSELRALTAQLAELQTKIQHSQTAVERLQAEVADRKRQVEICAEKHRATVDALAEHRLKLSGAQQRRAQLDEQRATVDGELQAAQSQQQTTQVKLAEAAEKRTAMDEALATAESELGRLAEDLAGQESAYQTHGREATEGKVALAKSEERLHALRRHLGEFEQGRQERGRALDDARQQLAQTLARADESRWTILRAESEVALLYLYKEGFASETLRKMEERERLQELHRTLSSDAQKVRGRIRKMEERMHAQELAASAARQERDALVARLREDYGIELADLEREPEGEPHERDEVQREIDELRGKINNLGNVNLEALDELESLESRYKLLSAQFEDLSNAKASLEKIIDKINTDSRRLFSETLATVKEHFQKLFRDLFGGGHGDIVLEENVDILEGGIEIVARPPGKEPRSISLLSGGEKTMTCVALLLAIFRSRPSPFCVLDEVDAALDEANIDRFTAVLHDFLTWTQFIIVTHSKKTMTCASTIYGVTMQESGVSKQVSVRFEDVSEDGQISEKRLKEAEQEAA